jgi:CRISPR-associated protein Cas2
MLLVAYDITDDKLRTRFAKFLSKYGGRLQYSIFEIQNSKRLLEIVQAEIESEFEPKFCQTDSVLIFQMSKQCKVTRFGYAKNDDDLLIIV